MEFSTSTSLPRRFVMTTLCAIAVLGSIETARAANREVRIKNITGRPCDDLHIETVEGTTITASPPFDHTRHQRGHDGGLWHTLYGTTVEPNDEAVVTLSAPNSDEIIIKNAWWTLGGDYDRDGDRVGDEFNDEDKGGAILSFLDGSSRGDGVVAVSIDGRHGLFQVPARLGAEDVARLFNAYLESFQDGSFDLIHNTLHSSRDVLYAGNVLGDPQAQLSVTIVQPDSGLPMQFRPLDLGPLLDLSGVCPGPVTAIVTNSLPQSQVFFYYGLSDAGATNVPQCPGVILSLGNGRFLGAAQADANGTARLRGNAPRSACGRVFLQAIELNRCLATNLRKL